MQVPTRWGVAPFGDRGQDSLKFHRVGWKERGMAQTCGLSETQTLAIAPEKKTGRRPSTQSPPTWGLLDLEGALEETRSKASTSNENADDESSAVSSPYVVAGGWGSSI